MKKLFTLIVLINICLFANAQAPVNDEPCGAIEIPVLPAEPLLVPCLPTTVYSYSNATLTAAIPNPTCVAITSGIKDVWYKFTTPPSGQCIVNTGLANSNNDIVMAAYTANTCNETFTFTEIGCNDNNPSIFPLLVAYAAAGDIVYIRVFMLDETASANFKLCAADFSINNNPTVDNSTKIGIGTTNPIAKLDVAGTGLFRDQVTFVKGVELRNGLKLPANAATGRVLTSDAAGNATWEAGVTNYWTKSGFIDIYNNTGGAVGIGTTNPLELLHIDGNIKLGNNLLWSSGADDRVIKFGDGNLVSIGERFADNQLQLKGNDGIIFRSNGDIEQMRLNALGKFGIGTANPQARLHVKDSNVVFTAPDFLPFPTSAGLPPVSGPGNRMMWYADKAAFRAGGINGSNNNWNKENVGQYSFASGFNTKASAFNTTAMGNGTEASGANSTALGLGSIAQGAASTAMGDGVFAIGDGSTAIGNAVVSKSRGSVALGSYNNNSDSPSPTSEAATDRIFQIGNGNSSGRSNALTVLRNGTIGVGTTNPTAKLEVNGNIKITDGTQGANKVLTSDASGAASWGSLPDGANAWIVNGAEIYNNNIGNVGINFITPTEKLQVEGNIKIGSSVWSNSSSDRTIKFGDSNIVSIGERFQDDQMHLLGYTGIVFRTNGDIERMRLSSTGNLGVGTSNPSNKLSVLGNADFTGKVGIGLNNPTYKLHLGIASDGLRIEGPAAAASGGSALNIGGYGDIVIDKPGTVGGRFMLNENGDAGFGTNAPNAYGHGGNNKIVEIRNFAGTGTNVQSHLMLSTQGNSGSLGGITWASTALTGEQRTGLVANFFETANQTRLGFFARDNAGGLAERFYIQGNGNAWLQGTLTQASDARLKKNIKLLSPTLNNLSQLNGYTYDWINEQKDKEQQIGLLAQEVQKIYPQLVKQNSAGELSVNYSGLVPLLLEGLKELSKKIEEQQKQIEDLKNK
jgi:hypothetical protein